MGFGKDDKGVIIREARSQALGALAAQAGILIGTKLAITDSFRMLKAVGSFVMDGLTSGESEGLLLFIANGDLTLAEAEAAIELSGPVDRSDRVNGPIAERFVQLVGATADGSSAVKAVMLDAHTGAPVIVAKPRWTFGQNDSWNWIVYNNGAALTTGATIKLRTQCFGVWVGA